VAAGPKGARALQPVCRAGKPLSDAADGRIGPCCLRPENLGKNKGGQWRGCGRSLLRELRLHGWFSSAVCLTDCAGAGEREVQPDRRY
jgi:hypothetical protein